MTMITPRLNFSGNIATPGVGQSHTESRQKANAMKPETFNEYERLFMEISAAIGNYDFTDILSSNATSLCTAIRETYALYRTNLVDLNASKLNVSGGAITGDLSIAGAVSIGSQLSVLGELQQMNAAHFNGAMTVTGNASFSSPVTISSSLHTVLDALFDANINVVRTVNASSFVAANSISTPSLSADNVTVTNIANLNIARFAGTATFDDSLVTNSLFTCNDTATFLGETVFSNSVSALAGVTFDKPVVFNDTISSTVLGKSPFSVASSVLVTNLNADKVDGREPATSPAAGALAVYNDDAKLVGSITGESTSCSGDAARSGIARYLTLNGDYTKQVVFNWETGKALPGYILGSDTGLEIIPVLASALSVATSAACTGNAETATALRTGAKINNVLFTGSTDITIACAANTLTGTLLPETITRASGLTTIGNASTVTNIIGSAAVGENLSVIGELTISTSINGVVGAINGTLVKATPYVDYLPPSTKIGGGTYTKVTCDTYGIITSGAYATTADIADSLDRRYVTDAQKSVLQSLSGVNTGDVINITGNAATATKLKNAVTINGVSFDGSSNITIETGSGIATQLNATGDAYLDVSLVGLIKGITSDATHCKLVVATADTDYVTPSGVTSILASLSSINIGNTEYGSSSIELGKNITTNTTTFINFHSAASTDFDARIIKWAGTNGKFDIINRGTGTINFRNDGDVTFGNLNDVCGASVSATGSIFSNTSISEARVGVLYIDRNNMMYMYANATGRGIYDDNSGTSVITRGWSDSVWTFAGNLTGNATTSTTAGTCTGFAAGSIQEIGRGLDFHSAANGFDYDVKLDVQAGASVGTGILSITGSLHVNRITGNTPNFHLDATGTGATYICYYSGTGGTKFCNGAGSVVASITSAGALTAASVNATSSRELKENILSYRERALDILKQTEICLYNFKSDKAKEQRIGMIAEDVPDFISPTHKSIDIGNTVAILIKSVQELMERLDTLESRYL